MDPALATGASPAQTVSFQDGLGDRRRALDPSGAEPIERLCLRSELTKIPSFEFALRERASRLAAFRHPFFARVRSVDRLNDASSTLTIVSDAVRGVRLSTLLTSPGRATIDLNAAVHLIRQLVSAVAVLHEHAPDVAHGALAPERIVITPNARVVIAEYVLGAALEQLRYSRDRYWSELRVAAPPTEGYTRLDHRADVTQIGVVALALILGRPLSDVEYPTLVGDLLASAAANGVHGGDEALPTGLRSWLARALQLDPRGTFESALDARDELERLLSDEDETMPEPAPRPATVASAPPPVVVPPPPAVTAPPPVFAAPPPVVSAPPPAPKAAIVGPEPAVTHRAEPQIEPERHEPRRVETPRAETPRVEPPRFEPPLFESFVPEPPLPEPPPFPRTVASASLLESVPDEEPVETRNWRSIAALTAIAAIVLGGAGFAARRFFAPGAPVVTTGTVSVTTVPPGAQIVVDGQARGLAPLTLSLPAGAHTLELRGGSDVRTMPISVSAGQQISQYVELAKAATFGRLEVRSEPAGAQVTIDGTERGKSPVAVDALAPGEHSVVLQSDIATVKQTVTIEAGQTASLVVPLASAEGAPVSGWISVTTPVDVQVYENKRLLGTTQSDRIMVSAGRHEFELVNEPLGYRVVRTIQVPPGKVASIPVTWPSGTVAINALPWAEVSVDGQRVGETPIGNLTLPIGPHEIVFRHPDLGEQRQAITVSLKTPARVSVDMRKKP